MAPQDKPAQGKALKDKGKTATDPAARGVARTEARLPKGFRDIEAARAAPAAGHAGQHPRRLRALRLRAAGDAGHSSTPTRSASSCPTRTGPTRACSRSRTRTSSG